MASKASAKFFCESCGAEVPRNARFCKKCGRFFASVRCPNCGGVTLKPLTGQELTGTAYPAGENFKVYADYSAEEWAQDAVKPDSTPLMTAQECAYAGGVSWEPLTVYTWDQLTGTNP